MTKVKRTKREKRDAKENYNIKIHFMIADTTVQIAFADHLIRNSVFHCGLSDFGEITLVS